MDLSAYPLLKILKTGNTAAGYAQGVAKLLQANGFSSRQISETLSLMKTSGGLDSRVNLSTILANLKKTEDSPSFTGNEGKTSILPEISYEKFTRQNDSLRNGNLPVIRVKEAYSAGLYRTATAFFSTLFAAPKGKEVEFRKNWLQSWTKRIMQKLFGENPPSETQRKKAILDQIRGLPPFMAPEPPLRLFLSKEQMIELLQRNLAVFAKEYGLESIPDGMAIQNVVSFFFSQNQAFDYFLELHPGLSELRLKLTRELENPGKEKFSTQEIKQLSFLMNTRESDLQETLENRQREDLHLIHQYLNLMEMAYDSLTELHDSKLAQTLAQADLPMSHLKPHEVEQFAIIDRTQKISSGQYPDLAFETRNNAAPST